MSNFLSTNTDDLNRVLSDQNRTFEEKQAQQKALTLQMPYMNLKQFPVDLQALSLFSEDEATHSHSIPFFKDPHDIRIGTIDPKNQLLKEKVKTFDPKIKVTIYLISDTSYSNLVKYYTKVARISSQFTETVQVDSKTDSLQKLQTLSDPNGFIKANATEILSDIFGAAITLNSSDIHLEGEEHLLKVRFRIDGVLNDTAHLPTSLQKTLISRIKMLSKLKLNIENEPQDGRMTVYQDNKPIDIRVSTLPSAYGESVVMRLLGVGATNAQVEDLGLQGLAKQVILNQIEKPNGMILTTGPTGSGKTTTLYAFLRKLNQPGVKIITLEDPVEYKLEGVQQTPIDHNVDFNFAKGLRSILRQDPDIVMVGEIRDPETAETALQAALTGHIVLSTLHTNDASGAVPRLITMGVKPFIIAPALNVIIAQRLVRRICQFCIQPQELDEALAEKVNQALKSIPAKAGLPIPEKPEFFHSTGCDKCKGLGYKGRIGVYEVIEVNDNIRAMINGEASGVEIRKAAVADGTVSMMQDGLVKALQKLTDLTEVFRVTGG